MQNNYQAGGAPYAPIKQDPTKPMANLDEATATENAIALICPCYVYGKAIAHLRNLESSIHTASCCTWGCIVCAGLASSSVGGSMVSAAAGTQAAQALYVFFCMGYYLPHCVCSLPLSLEMRAKKSGLQHPSGCESRAILQTTFCPCCVLASVEKWAQKNKGKVILEQDSSCILPPMQLKMREGQSLIP
jgi:hypothetical protein